MISRAGRGSGLNPWAKAAHEAQNPDWPWERYKSEYTEEAEEDIEAMRIGLRAFAEFALMLSLVNWI